MKKSALAKGEKQHWFRRNELEDSKRKKQNYCFRKMPERALKRGIIRIIVLLASKRLNRLYTTP